MMQRTEEAIKTLKFGNHRFKLGQSQNPNNSPIRRQELLQNGQEPFATVLTCADSRMPVELIFDQGIGDIFVIRNAGNILYCKT